LSDRSCRQYSLDKTIRLSAAAADAVKTSKYVGAGRVAVFRKQGFHREYFSRVAVTAVSHAGSLETLTYILVFAGFRKTFDGEKRRATHPKSGNEAGFNDIPVKDNRTGSANTR
jgi:hypothetical protein